MHTINEHMLFPSILYTVDKPEFLPSIKEVTATYLAKAKQKISFNESYPVYQTEGLQDDPKLFQFTEFVGQTAWEILMNQGFAMENFSLIFSEMWLQEHHKNSGMEQHIHGYGSQITGFYFVQCPPDSMRVIFHDPRPGKVQVNLPDRDMTQASYASSMINFAPTEGQFMFTNSWLPHTFSRNTSHTPFQFIHFNLVAQINANANPTPTVEVI